MEEHNVQQELNEDGDTIFFIPMADGKKYGARRELGSQISDEMMIHMVIKSAKQDGIEWRASTT